MTTVIEFENEKLEAKITSMLIKEYVGLNIKYRTQYTVSWRPKNIKDYWHTSLETFKNRDAYKQFHALIKAADSIDFIEVKDVAKSIEQLKIA